MSTAILLAALGLGLLGDLLLRAEPWGLNIWVWTLALVAVTYGLGSRAGRGWTPAQTVLAVLVAAFAAAFTWRDAPALNALAGLGLITLAFGFTLAQRVASWASASLHDLAETALGIVIRLFAGPAPLLRGADGPASGTAGSGRVWARLAEPALGVAISVPLLLVFGHLLLSADPVFESLLAGAFDVEWANISTHVFLILFFAWASAGWLRQTVLVAGAPLSISVPRIRPALGIFGVGIPLALLDALLLGFVVVQIRYLFGGASLVEVMPGLTYAEYARRGFFELVAAAALVLPLLLGADSILRVRSLRDRTAFRILAGALAALVFVMMVSALRRMRLYQLEFGWTELRLYTTAFMLWVGFVLAWLAVTILRGGRRRFPFVACVSGLAAIVVLHALDPHDRIVRHNLARSAEGRPFDAEYATSLSADAVPALLDGLAILDPSDRAKVAGALLERWGEGGGSDWRSWNASRARARHLVGQRSAELRAMVEP